MAFQIGGIGAGMFCLEGTDAVSHVSVRNTIQFFNEPCTFAAISIKEDVNVARVLEGPVLMPSFPVEKPGEAAAAQP